jgi:hypothetical protein
MLNEIIGNQFPGWILITTDLKTIPNNLEKKELQRKFFNSIQSIRCRAKGDEL